MKNLTASIERGNEYLDQKTDEEHVKELSLLTTFEYDRIRDEKAKELGIQINTLDKAVREARKETRVDEFKIDSPDLWPELTNSRNMLVVNCGNHMMFFPLLAKIKPSKIY